MGPYLRLIVSSPLFSESAIGLFCAEFVVEEEGGPP